MRHYRSLLRNGFDRYVSVNRFDVARAAKPYEGASATPRYFYYGTQVAVRMQFRRGDQQYDVAGTAERVGGGGGDRSTKSARHLGWPTTATAS